MAGTGKQGWQVDPYGGSMRATNPQTFNRYSYVQNDPMNLIDPSGLDDTPSIGTFGAGNIYAGPDPATTLPVMMGSNIVMHRQQNPLRPPNIAKQIYRRSRERVEARKHNTQAWGDYRKCVLASPESIEYEQAFRQANLRASLPIPSTFAFGKATVKTVQGIQQGRGVTAALQSNIFGLIFSALLHPLLANLWEDTKELRDKVVLVESRCMNQVQEKYGFSPVSPTNYGK